MSIANKDKSIINIKSILNIIGAATVSAHAVVNPVGTIVFAASVEVLKGIGIFICEKANEYSKEKNLLVECLGRCPSIESLSMGEKEKLILKASEIVKEINPEDYNEGVDTRELGDSVLEIIKGKVTTTGDTNIQYIADIIVFGILYFNIVLDKNDKNAYIINENEARKKEIDASNKRINELDGKCNDLTMRVDSIENNNSVTRKNNIENEYVYFIRNFTEQLYLHKDSKDKEINLKNLFVFPRIEQLNESQKTTDYNHKRIKNIKEFLSNDFNKQDKALVLLGDGGSGKTSIISWLTYLYKSDIEAVKDERYKIEDRDRIFHNRKLIVIRCRLLDVNQIKGANGSIYKSICSFLDVNPDDTEFFRDKYIILDGFDELCLAEGIINWKTEFDLLLDSSVTSGKVIITSRPGMVSTDYRGGIYYTVRSFSIDEKIQWLDFYTKYTDEIVDENVKAHILSDNENGIFIYPQLLYMVAGQKEDDNWQLDNKWSLYHHIFYDELFSKPYTKDYKYLEGEKEFFYSLTEMIAYELYKKGYEKTFDNNQNQINKLINSLIEKTNEKGIDYLNINKNLAQNCFALCCFYNQDNEQGVIEFLHNNIRDFFIAEYLFDRLNEIFVSESNDNSANENIPQKMYDLLGCIPISKELIEFFSGRALARGESDEFYSYILNNAYFIKKDEFCYSTISNPPIAELLDQFTKNIDIYRFVESERSNTTEISIVNRVARVLNSIWTIIHGTFKDKCENEYIVLNTGGYNEEYMSSMLLRRRSVFDRGPCMENAFLGDSKLSNANLDHIDFKGACFFGADLRRSSIRAACLEKACLVGARIDRTDLSLALLVEANLSGVVISESALENANLKNANLTSARIIDSNLRYICMDYANLENAWLNNSDLYHAHLLDTDLNGAYLINACLLKAQLTKVKLRKANLNKAVLQGATIIESDLEGASLRRTNLKIANLSKSCLIGVDLKGARLILSNLTGVKLIGADLREANLREANLREANLTGANMEKTNLFGTIMIDAKYDKKDIRKANNWEKAIYSRDNDENKRIIEEIINS